MNITYRQNGDYLIPNIVIRKTKPLGHYGRLRKAYLKMHRPIHPLAPLKRLSPVDLPSANGFDKPFAASKFENQES